MPTVTIAAINLKTREVLLSDGDILVITTWLDAWGDECDGPEDGAERFVAGRNNRWLTGDIGDYEPRPITIH